LAQVGYPVTGSGSRSEEDLRMPGGAWGSRCSSAYLRWPSPRVSPPRNCARKRRRPAPGTASTAAPTPSLVVSRRKAWRGVTGICRLPRIGVGDGVTGRARVGAVLAVTRGPGAGASRTWMPSAARPRTAASGTRGISPVLRLFRRGQGGGRGWLQSVQGGPWSRVGGKGRARLPCGEAKRTPRP